MAVENSWQKNKKVAENEKDKNYLALATQILKIFSKDKSNDGKATGVGKGVNNRNTNCTNSGDQTLQLWRFDNPNNDTTKHVKGSTMPWCSSDCHEKPMWCRRTK